MTGWFFANLAWASLLMLVVLAARRPFAALFGAGPAYALWLLPALRLVMPQMPSLAPDLPALAPAETLVVWVGDAAAPLPPQGGPGQWVPLMLAIWALGAAAFLLWQFVSYRRFVAEMRATARSLGDHCGVALIESGAVQGPVALGLIRRRIVVPADFDTRYTPEEQRLALDHERIHHRRGDIWWNHLGLIVLALNWFNPVAWLAFRAFRIDQELACDAAVAAGASPETRHDYARALIKSASRPGLIAACPLNHADQLKRRLKMMKTHKASRLRLLGGAAAVTLLAGAGLALGSPGFAQAGAAPPAAAQGEAAEGQRSEERIIIRTHHDGAGGHGAHAQRSAPAAHGDPERRVVIVTNPGSGGAHAGHGAPDVRTVRIHHGEGGEAGPGNREEHRIILNRGPGGEGPEADMADCNRGQRSEVNEGEGNQRTRIILCTRGTNTATPAQRAERLQSMRDRLANDNELTAEQRTRVGAAIDREIARLRAP
ncbi:MAG TPA: M56 family metallopeptidase [Allosphingosinicella sp.]|nr:M56 family metallopeptidase [Allosphingosinicella sp.]